ncbi:hypothetical protein IE987_04895 [Klebsiella pneumoniae]|uniref:Uncharacterized protein n=1 Tax=Klebsiella pneumoniae TaxID=573 RepID=A0A927DNQ7_KLEPN|nr:hypothetical protein [Klebsiella pneumoniae]MBD3707871.1 hypothetical protein [Klebsiella pneumoniae]MBD3719683.1 hypothetical protein [Klebsiella pneumoniae]
MNSLSKIALFTLLSGAVFAARGRRPARRYGDARAARRRAGAKHPRQRRH